MKSASKKRSTSHNNGRNRARRHSVASPTSVKPVAHMVDGNPSEATIPVAIRTTGDMPDAEALIPVEVQRAGKSVKRAAVIPVTVRRASKSRKPTTAGSRPTQRNGRNPGEARARTMDPRLQQRDVITNTVVALANVEEGAVNLAGQLGLTVLGAVPKLVGVALGTIAHRLDQGVEVLLADADAVAGTLAA